MRLTGIVPDDDQPAGRLLETLVHADVSEGIEDRIEDRGARPCRDHRHRSERAERQDQRRRRRAMRR
jgi:hypothetical protein